MKVWHRRLLWGALFLSLLVLVALVAGYIGRNLSGIGPIPVRSAFAGRLPGTPEGDRRRFQFFYATNRLNSDDTFNARGNELGDEILTGTYDVLISPDLQIRPFIWFDTRNIDWAGRNELPKDEFRLRLREAVQASPKKSLLVIVWGYRDWFRSAALKTAYTSYVLDINTPVLLFDWPGNQGDGPRGYRAARQISEQSAPDLGRTLATVMRDTGSENVWLMGSSLGCQTICDALAWLTTQPDLLQDKPKISHVILSAPDVSAQAFDGKFSHTIQTLSEHLTAYVSSNDRALLMSQWLNRGRRLGRKAEVMVPPDDRSGEYEFEEALELLDLQAKGARNISIVDATPINLLRNLHHFFTDSSAFFDDLYQRLLRPDDIVNRRLHSVRTRPQGGVTYWILWNE
jgi:pimeloyl-ACP methyl ester carboxylesterase